MHFRQLVLALAISTVGCNTDATKNDSGTQSQRSNDAAMTDVELFLNWRPEAEHGGFYAAEVHGYFQAEGLNVKITAGGPGILVIPQVLSRKESFGVTNADRLFLGRAQDADIVALMSPMQQSPRCLIVSKSSGISKFRELKNRTIAVSATSTFAQFLSKNGFFNDVRIVPYNGNPGRFMEKEIDAQQGYIFSEPFIAKKNGGDPHCLMVSETGFNPYTSLLFSDRAVIESNPALVKKMVRASIRGWKHYLAEPDETNKLIHKLNPEMDLDVLQYGAEQLKKLCVSESVPLEKLGHMTSDRWTTLAAQLVEAGSIEPDSVDATKAFTTQFLETSRNETAAK